MLLYWMCLAAGLLSVVIAIAATPVIKSIAVKYEWLDVPCSRKVHREPVVRLGGVAIFMATILIAIVFIAIVFSEAVGVESLGLESLGLKAGGFQALAKVAMHDASGVMLLGGSGFFLIGLTDDLLNLSAVKRLGMQCAVSAGVWLLGIRVETLALPGLSPVDLAWLSLPVTVLWLAGVVNAINWMDGLDGLAAGVAGIATGAVMVVAMVTMQPMLALVAAALLGSLLGFLYHNSHPASIFMGDGGSYFVGFVLASLCIVESQSLASLPEYAWAGLLPLTVLAVPLGDMCWVILARLFQGSSPFEADNRHLHHRLLRLGLSHRRAVWVVYGLAAIAGSGSLAMMQVAGPWLWMVGAVSGAMGGAVGLGMAMGGWRWPMQAETGDRSEQSEALSKTLSKTLNAVAGK